MDKDKLRKMCNKTIKDNLSNTTPSETHGAAVVIIALLDEVEAKDRKVENLKSEVVIQKSKAEIAKRMQSQFQNTMLDDAHKRTIRQCDLEAQLQAKDKENERLRDELETANINWRELRQLDIDNSAEKRELESLLGDCRGVFVALDPTTVNTRLIRHIDIALNKKGGE